MTVHESLLSGNAWTDAAVDNRGAVQFWHSHGIISFSTQEGINDKCNFSVIGPLMVSVGPTFPAPSPLTLPYFAL